MVDGNAKYFPQPGKHGNFFHTLITEVYGIEKTKMESLYRTQRQWQDLT